MCTEVVAAAGETKLNSSVEDANSGSSGRSRSIAGINSSSSSVEGVPGLSMKIDLIDAS